MLDMDDLRERTLKFIESVRLPDGGSFRYRYSHAVSKPTLYSSADAARTRSLYNDLDSLTDEERAAWIDYFNAHQDDDGLFRDPVIYGQGWYADDVLWCGRPHLTGQVIAALTCLGGVARKPFEMVRRFSDPDRLRDWLASRDWGDRMDFTGNEICNVGRLLQYARDFQNDEAAGRAAHVMLEWLDTHHVNPETGMWGSFDVADPLQRSRAVQGVFHWWLLFFYDRRPVPYVERAVDTVLATQTSAGGFGCGVHNPEEPFKSSACEDIDSIDPLVRMYFVTDYRREDIRAALERALPWVLSNQGEDGGFVFVLDRPYEYGHPELRSEKNMGAMFPTWFRTLSLAYLGKVLAESPVGRYPWNFVNCPGPQFWRDEPNERS